ncbi:MAG: peptidylprolyl isomerase [Syntrophobacteraceae bacterium]
MKKVEKGNFVKVCYTASFEDGEVFEQCNACNAIEVEVGGGEVLQGFDDALLGMAQNEKKTFTLEAAEAYGLRDEEAETRFARSELPADFIPKLGEIIVLHNEEGYQVPATITHFDDENMTVDLNHPLAGRSITFDIEVTEINEEATESEPMCGSGCSCH